MALLWDSERASWVVATLERRVAGENPLVQRVQVTAVMEYVGGKLPFRIWHWQAVALPLQVREAAVESVPVREAR